MGRAKASVSGKGAIGMTNTQLYLAIGLPTLAVLASLTVSLLQISGIREDIREIRADIKVIVSKLADLDNRISVMEKRIK
jgi:hypothetical protein